MYRSVWAILGAALIWGCGPKQMTVEDTAKEKKAVETVVANFWKAYETKDAEVVNKLISSTTPLAFFGTDSAEVIKGADDWKTQMRNDMKLFDSFKAGEPKNVSTEVSSTGDMAATISELPVDMKMGKQKMHALARFAFTLKKEKDDWRITQGMVAFATKGQSSAEMVAKMKAPKRGGKRK